MSRGDIKKLNFLQQRKKGNLNRPFRYIGLVANEILRVPCWLCGFPYLVWILRSESLAVLFRSDDLERFVISKHGKDDVADLMHDSAHCYWFFLARTLSCVVVVNDRIHRCAASFINLYVIECDHVKNPSGKAGTAFGHMDFIAIEFSRLFDGRVKPKVKCYTNVVTGVANKI